MGTIQQTIGLRLTHEHKHVECGLEQILRGEVHGPGMDPGGKQMGLKISIFAPPGRANTRLIGV